jgi:hypothetical protein
VNTSSSYMCVLRYSQMCLVRVNLDRRELHSAIELLVSTQYAHIRIFIVVFMHAYMLSLLLKTNCVHEVKIIS